MPGTWSLAFPAAAKAGTVDRFSRAGLRRFLPLLAKVEGRMPSARASHGSPADPFLHIQQKARAPREAYFFLFSPPAGCCGT